MGCFGPKVFKVRDGERKSCDDNPQSSGEFSKGDSGASSVTNSGSHPIPDPSSNNNEQAEVIVGAVVDGVGIDTVLTQSGSLRKPNDLRDFTYQELRHATKNFDRKCLLGEGGFGQVFKGQIRQKQKFGGGEEKIDVAVKQLNSRSQQGHKEWLAEVHFLGLVDCPHLVKLIGYCATDDDERGIQRLLVYEFMPNKGLDDHLFHRGPNFLSWASRVKIVMGAARGLAYLHEELEIQIIFRDFKTSNVLLDEDFEPKLSDFGLARQGPQDGDSHVSTAVVGTAGYAAPEYIQTGHLTVKSDVWSFGIVMLEVLTGRRVMDRNRPKNEQRLVEWAKPFINDHHKLFQVVDPLLNGRYPVKPAQKFAQLAYQCLHKFPKHRPKMSEVVEKLKMVQERTAQWENPTAVHSPHSQEFSPRSLGLGSLPTVRSGKVSKLSPRIRDSGSSVDSSRPMSNISLESSSVDPAAEKPKAVPNVIVEEPTPNLGEEPKLVREDPTPNLAEKPNPVDTPNEEEPKPVEEEHKPEEKSKEQKPDAPGEAPKPMDTTEAKLEEPKFVDTKDSTLKAVGDIATEGKLLVEEPKVGMDTIVSEKPKAQAQEEKRRSWGSDKLARMSRESGRFTWIPKLYASLNSS
jgi:serine/threonine protein kinase